MPTEGDGEIAASSSADSNPVSTSATTGLHPTPIAVVIDANLWHKHLNVDRLAAHAARLQKSGIDVWVPEQVALEWAEHAHEEIQQIAERWKKPEVAGICGPLPGPSSIHDVVATVIEILQSIPNVKVIEMTGAAAIAGIKDQILKTGSGKRENGVKTGASDSSFVRDALAAAGDDPSKVLFVSGNTRDIEAAAAAAGHTHVNSTKESRLYKVLFGTDAAPATIATMVTSHLFSLATTQAHGDAHMLPPEPWINVGEVEMSAVEHIDFEITSADLYPHPTLVGITELNVVDSDTAGDQYDITAEFNLVLLGDVDVSGYTLDNDGHVQMSSTTATQMIVVVPFIADIEDHHVGLTVNGSAEASPATIRTRDPLDGIEHAASWLSDLVGITFPYDADLHQEFTLSGLNGNSSQVYLSSDWEEPTLHVDLGGQEVVIASRYDVGSRVWDGKEGFDLYPPYYLSSSVDGLSEEAFTSLSQIWEYLVSPAATDS